MRRLANMTQNEIQTALVPGTVIAYEDMANPYTKYTIENIFTTRWATEAVMISEDGNVMRIAIDGGFQHGWTLVH